MQEPKARKYCKAVKELGKNTRLLGSHPDGENQDLICPTVFRERRLSPQAVRALPVSLTPDFTLSSDGKSIAFGYREDWV